MKILLIIIVTLIVNWVGYFLWKYNKNRQLKRDEDLFDFKLQQIISNKNLTIEKRVKEAKTLCRMTKGKMAAASYYALDYIQANINDFK